MLTTGHLIYLCTKLGDIEGGGHLLERGILVGDYSIDLLEWLIDLRHHLWICLPIQSLIFFESPHRFGILFIDICLNLSSIRGVI